MYIQVQYPGENFSFAGIIVIIIIFFFLLLLNIVDLKLYCISQ